MTLELITDDDIDKALGTISAQKVFRTLTTWGRLSRMEIKNNTNIPDRELEEVLHTLVQANILQKETGDMYMLYTSPFVDRLTEAYLEQIKQYLNQQLYKIHQIIKLNEDEKASQLYTDLKKRYKPILTKYFSHQLSGLAHQFLEKYDI